MNPPEPSQPPVASQPKPFPGFAQSLWVILVYLFFSTVLLIPTFVLRHLSFPQTAAWTLLLGQVGALLLTLKVCAPRGGDPWSPAFPSRAVPWATWPLTFVVSAGLILVTNGLDAWVSHLIPPSAALRQGLEIVGWPGLVLGAPLTEEALVRGLILGGFALRYGTRKAILYSALLFGAMHLNLWQFPGAFLMGLFAAWLTLRMGSLWPAVLAHVLNNLTVTVSRAYQLPYLWDERFQPLWMWGLGLLLLGSGLAALDRLTRAPAPRHAPQTAGL